MLIGCHYILSTNKNILLTNEKLLIAILELEFFISYISYYILLTGYHYILLGNERKDLRMKERLLATVLEFEIFKQRMSFINLADSHWWPYTHPSICVASVRSKTSNPWIFHYHEIMQYNVLVNSSYELTCYICRAPEEKTEPFIKTHKYSPSYETLLLKRSNLSR